MVASKLPTCDYDETIDLLTLVTVCATNAEGAKAREINKAALAVAGLEFRSAVPTVLFKRGEKRGRQPEVHQRTARLQPRYSGRNRE